RIGNGEDEVIFGHKDNHVFFKIGRTIVTSTLIAAKFPDYRKVIPEDNQKLLKMESSQLADVVRRVSLLSSDRSRAVKLSVSKGSLEISSNNPEVGEASETIDLDYDGESMAIGSNARYLSDFLQAIGSGPVILALKDAGTQGLFRPVGVEGRDYRYVVMPMRL
ncbi:MAG: DNA polymerase III subunit beta, partial [Acidobacteriota bacterium]